MHWLRSLVRSAFYKSRMEKHITVLSTEAIDALAIFSCSKIVDATLGSGGHALQILSKLSDKGTLIALDIDSTAIDTLQEKLKLDNVQLVVSNFKNIDTALENIGINKVDGILADLGWRMEQFSGSEKGFSFQIDEPLLMTFGDSKEYLFTAKDIVNDWEAEDIANVLKGYGEERFAKMIAEAIVKRRVSKPIESSLQLVEVIKGAVPGFYRNGRIHPATRTFQALRIAVNDELKALEQFIEKAVGLLNNKGRLVIITFHSIEDRIVKHTFRSFANKELGTVLTKKPIIASRDEINKNPRARSAKLRIFEKNEQA